MNRKTTDKDSTSRETRALIMMSIVILSSVAIGTGVIAQIKSANGDSCPPGPLQYGSTTNIWTPQLLLDSPYQGSATGFSGVHEEIWYNFAGIGDTKIDTAGWQMSRSNGQASGVFEVGTWQKVSQTRGCLDTLYTWAQFNGYYNDPSCSCTRTTTYDLAPSGTLSDASVITQFSSQGFSSMSFDMAYEHLDNDFSTPGGSATYIATGDCGWAGCGACGVWYSCTFFNPSVSIGAFGVSGNFEGKYSSTQQYDYSYSFPGGFEWHWNYKSSPNFLLAFNFVGICSTCDPGGGGGGSPWIGVLSTSGQYNFLNNILRGGMFSKGQTWHDANDYYMLPTVGTTSNGQYLFEIFERNAATNYIDSLSAYTIDHPAGTNVLATLDGKVLTYSNPIHALSVEDITSGTPVDITGALSTSLSTSFTDSYIAGTAGHTLYADFGNVQARNAKLILQGENAPNLCGIACPKSPISASIQTKGGWVQVGYLFPRVNGSTEGLDLTPYIKDQGQAHLKVKLVYLGGEKVSFVGLDTSPSASVSVSSLLLTQAIASQGDITSLLTNTDGNYVTLGPLQVFRVTFPATSPPPNLIRNVMLVSTGHYIV